MSNSNITAGNFKAKLSAFKRSAKSQRDNLQHLLMFAVNHAAENNDEFTALNQVIAATVEVRSFRTETIKDYIKSMVTNIVYTKLGDGTYGFKKIKKGAGTCEYSAPECPWYNFNDKGQAKADIHPLVQLKSWATRTKKALQEDKVQDEEEKAKALEALEAVDRLLA